MIRELRYILAVLIGVSMMVSCADEPIIQGSGDIPEGYATISAKVSFKPFGSALNGGSRTAGDAIKDINSLYILFYDESQNLIQELGFDATKVDGYDYEAVESREDVQPGDGEHIAEQKTPCAKFKKTIPYGKYYIYAVANYDLTDKDYSTIDKLRNLQLTWNDDVATNNEMFGYFTTSKVNGKPNGWQSADPIAITSPTVNLHAWVRRAASKVTIAYDGSKLRENVFVTIKSVQIKDIPEYCKLGTDYAVLSEEDLISDGEIIRYTTSATDNNGPVISKGGVTWNSTHIEGWENPYDPTGTNGIAHTETSQALFFYENLQGTGEPNTSTDKSVNRLEYLNKGKSLGTYIEVKAEYLNQNFDKMTKGEITYHFMLGKDATIDYNAERNYHYKLTLCFKNNANDVDWRIVYDEEPGIYVPNPYYISYLYNESMELPLKVVYRKEQGSISWMQAQIIENNWEPDGNTEALGDTYYGNSYTTYSAYTPSGEVTGTIGAGNTNIPWLGFLSLRDEFKLNGDSIYREGGFDGDINAYKVSSEPYNWWTAPDGNSDNHLGSRGDYWGELVGTTGANTESVAYRIPLYTRLKQLYIVSGFTGNNPYSGYRRTATVRFTAHMTNGDSYTQDVKIIQIKRIVNPTGIWRNKDNASPFNVALQVQKGWGGDFEDVISEGPWSVRVLASTHGDWFTVSPTSGNTGSAVNFTYTPNGTTAEPRCGIIEVKFHNNTCQHLIFVRQGYDPIAIQPGGKKWFSFNMKSIGTMTSSPLDEGSLYRYGKWEYPISEVNNMTPELYYGVDPGDTPFVLEGLDETKTWEEIGSIGRTESFDTPISGAVFPTLSDWKTLQMAAQGYGVLYADGASRPAVSTTGAYGYRDAYNEPDKGARGMRGVFAYNRSTGANVFFPIGALGYGHRKQQHSLDQDGIYKYGILRYGTVNYPLTTSADYRPMLYGLYEQNGAIYWTAELGNAWDINYQQLDFNVYSYNNAWAQTDGDGNVVSDACFVRLLKYEAPTTD